MWFVIEPVRENEVEKLVDKTLISLENGPSLLHEVDMK